MQLAQGAKGDILLAQLLLVALNVATKATSRSFGELNRAISALNARNLLQAPLHNGLA